jgi:hypothetical protein
MAKHETVYRQKPQGKGTGYPKVGKPEGILPGDYLTFFIDNAHHTREVASIHKGYVRVKPVTIACGESTHMLHKGRKVVWKDIIAATRLLTAEAYEAWLYLEANPPPPPEPKPPKPPKGTRKRVKKPTPVEAPVIPIEPPAATVVVPVEPVKIAQVEPPPVKVSPVKPPKPKPVKAQPELPEGTDFWALLTGG